MYMYHVQAWCPYKRAFGPRRGDLDLLVVRYPKWVLGTKPGFSSRAANALSCLAISPVPRQRNLCQWPRPAAMKMESTFNHYLQVSWAPVWGLTAFGLDNVELSVESFL